MAIRSDKPETNFQSMPSLAIHAHQPPVAKRHCSLTYIHGGNPIARLVIVDSAVDKLSMKSMCAAFAAAADSHRLIRIVGETTGERAKIIWRQEC
jgi:hypothetical protein